MIIHYLNRRRLLLVTGLILLLAGQDLSRAAGGVTSQSSLNDGYSLFYDFCKQESQLSLLRWFKTMPPDISDYAKRISSTAAEDMAALKEMGVEDSAIRLDKISLPGFEINVRQSMADDRKQLLLWGSSGAAFAQAVTMTQGEVTNYGLHVVKILSESEPDPTPSPRLTQDVRAMVGVA